MAEGLGRERWGHTAQMLSLIANCSRDPKKHRAFKPDDFNPYAEKKTRSNDIIEVTPETLEFFRKSFKGETT